MLSSIHLVHARILGYLLWRALTQDSTLNQDGDFLSKLEYQIHIVLNQDDGEIMRQGPDHGADGDTLGRRQTRRRLVEHQEGRPQHQSAGDLHEAQFAVLQAVGAGDVDIGMSGWGSTGIEVIDGAARIAVPA